MNIKPVYRYKLIEFFKGMAIVFAVIFAIFTVLTMVSVNTESGGTFSFSGYAMAATIYMFVMGIVGIRSDLRLFSQFGVSRRTTFITELMIILTAAFTIGLLGELLTGLAQAIFAGNENVFIGDIYQLIYLGESARTLSLFEHIQSLILNVSLAFCACIGGMFFSLLFWRLNRLFTIIVAISIPLLMNIVPYLLVKAHVDLTPVLNWILSSPLSFVLLFFALAAVFAVIDWLLLRRANIKEAK